MTDLNKIFTKSTCLSNIEMNYYLSGDLSVQGKRKVELHIADCQMCSDELEGLSYLENKNNLTSIVSTINTYIDKKTKSLLILPKKTNFKKIFALAASIALLLSIGWLIKDIGFSSSKEIAQNIIPSNENVVNKKELNTISEDKRNEVEINETSDSKIVNNIEDNDVTAENLQYDSDSQQIIENETEKEDILEEDNEIYKTEDVITEVSDEESGLEENLGSSNTSDKELISENKKIKKETVENQKEKNESVFAPGKSRGINKNKNSKVVVNSLRERGILSFKVKSYKEATDDFEKYLIGNRKDYEIIYKAGVAYYHQKRYNVALNKFNKIIKGDFNKFVEGAEWYKSLTLLKQGRKEDALKLLKEIAYGHSDFKKQASDKIKEIEK